MDWEDTITEAKEALGYGSGEWVEDFDEVVDLALKITKERNKNIYRTYLKSKRWIEIRREVMVKYDFICVDCGTDASEVHHTTYINLGRKKEDEIKDCVALCNDCHRGRHDLEIKPTHEGFEEME